VKGEVAEISTTRLAHILDSNVKTFFSSSVIVEGTENKKKWFTLTVPQGNARLSEKVFFKKFPTFCAQ